jgi:predicted phosphatase
MLLYLHNYEFTQAQTMQHFYSGRIKAWTNEAKSTNKVMIDRDKSIWVLDPVSGYYTRCHIVTDISLKEMIAENNEKEGELAWLKNVGKSVKQAMWGESSKALTEWTASDLEDLVKYIDYNFVDKISEPTKHILLSYAKLFVEKLKVPAHPNLQ